MALYCVVASFLRFAENPLKAWRRTRRGLLSSLILRHHSQITVSHFAPLDVISRAEIRCISFHGAADMSYSMISYVRPHVFQLVHGARLGCLSQGNIALRLSSTNASASVKNSPPCGSAWHSSSMINILNSGAVATARLSGSRGASPENPDERLFSYQSIEPAYRLIM